MQKQILLQFVPGPATNALDYKVNRLIALDSES